MLYSPPTWITGSIYITKPLLLERGRDIHGKHEQAMIKRVIERMNFTYADMHPPQLL